MSKIAVATPLAFKPPDRGIPRLMTKYFANKQRTTFSLHSNNKTANINAKKLNSLERLVRTTVAI